METIPKQVIKAAEDRANLGGTLKMIGKHKGYDVYTYDYPIPVTVGMPELYLWNGNKVKVIREEEALELISLFPPTRFS